MRPRLSKKNTGVPPRLSLRKLKAPHAEQRHEIGAGVAPPLLPRAQDPRPRKPATPPNVPPPPLTKTRVEKMSLISKGTRCIFFCFQCNLSRFVQNDAFSPQTVNFSSTFCSGLFHFRGGTLRGVASYLPIGLVPKAVGERSWRRRLCVGEGRCRGSWHARPSGELPATRRPGEMDVRGKKRQDVRARSW